MADVNALRKELDRMANAQFETPEFRRPYRGAWPMQGWRWIDGAKQKTREVIERY
jgi:hypothetical protein